MTNPLQQMPCFALYAASRSVSQAYRAVLADEDLTYPQFLVLVVLASDGESSVGDLAATMLLDSGTLSPLLKRLESRGIVSRERRPGNERTVVVDLTAEGLRLHEKVAAEVDCLNPAYGFEHMDEVAELLARLHTITSGMSELTADLRTTR